MSRLSCAFTYPQHCVFVCVLTFSVGRWVWHELSSEFLFGACCMGEGKAVVGLYSFQDNEWKSFDSKYINNAKCASLESARRADILQLICIHMRKRIHNIHDINHRLMRYSCYSHVTYS